MGTASLTTLWKSYVVKGNRNEAEDEGKGWSFHCAFFFFNGR